MRKFIFIILFIISLDSFGQGLPVKVVNFMFQQTSNGYVMRGVDVMQVLHIVLSNNFNCIDRGVTCSDLSTNMTHSYPMIGTTLTSMSLNLVSPSTDAFVFTGSPTANDGSITFSGSGQYANKAITGSSLPSGTGALSLAIFFKFSSNATCEIMGLGGNVGTGARFAMFYQSNGLFVDGNAENAKINWTWDANWHLMVITKPAGASGIPVNFVIYLDGNLMSIASTSGTTAINIPSNGDLSIARVPTSPSLYFPGTLKFAAVWSRQISNTEQNQFWLSHKYLVGL